MTSESQPRAPIAQAERFSLALNDGGGDGEIAGWRWANPDKPPLLFCHATGFCASVYKQMLSRLSSQFDVYAIDLRGHGRTTLEADPAQLRSWRIYALDIGRFLDAMPHPQWTLAGHSMGAVTVTKAARGRSDIKALRLVEPVAPPRFLVLAAKTPFWAFVKGRIPIAKNAAKRRARWPDVETVKQSYARKPIFKSWAAGVLDDYLEDGLAEDEEVVRLSCAPAWEAATFQAQANDLWTAVRNAPCSIDVLVANHPTSTVFTGARRLFRRYGASLTAVDQASHLLPMENPRLAAEFVANGA